MGFCLPLRKRPLLLFPCGSLVFCLSPLRKSCLPFAFFFKVFFCLFAGSSDSHPSVFFIFALGTPRLPFGPVKWPRSLLLPSLGHFLILFLFRIRVPLIPMPPCSSDLQFCFWPPFIVCRTTLRLNSLHLMVSMATLAAVVFDSPKTTAFLF